MAGVSGNQRKLVSRSIFDGCTTFFGRKLEAMQVLLVNVPFAEEVFRGANPAALNSPQDGKLTETRLPGGLCKTVQHADH
jgi:hypothetical protein